MEVFRFSLENQEVSRLYSRRRENTFHPGKLSVSTEGDFLALHFLQRPDRFSLLIIVDFEKDQIVFAKIPDGDHYLPIPVSKCLIHCLPFPLNSLSLRIVKILRLSVDIYSSHASPTRPFHTHHY